MKTLAWLILAACPACFAAESAQAILRHTAAAYHDLRGFEFEVTVQTIQEGKVSQSRWIESGAGPEKYRCEETDPHGEIRVSDGHTLWVFNRVRNEYTKAAAASADSPIAEFAQIDQNVREASIAREEKLLIDGRPVPVYVVQVVRSKWPAGSLDSIQFAMYRIDQRDYRIYKVASYAKNTTRIALYSIRRWNEPAPDERFAFTPPDSARLAASAAAPSAESTALIGGDAADFTLSDTHGHPVHLRDLRGKVVVLDFWATWCPPCRALMPHLEEMYRELASGGLVLLGLDVGEEAKTVADFAKQHGYTFTLLLGAEPDVAAKYYVQAYPTTFVIDRRGRIVFTDMGGEAFEKLRTAVKSAIGEGPGTN